MKHAPILFVDAVINLVLGILLVAFPPAIVTWLGVPMTSEPFYPSILGAVLFGIGIALLVECFRKPGATGGLGLAGAIVINVCGSMVLGVWLLSDVMVLPQRGKIMLWALLVLLIGLSSLEWILFRMDAERQQGRQS
jgi:hypothetical protein